MSKITMKAKVVVADYAYMKEKLGNADEALQLLKLVHIPLPYGARGTSWAGSLMEPEEDVTIERAEEGTPPSETAL